MSYVPPSWSGDAPPPPRPPRRGMDETTRARLIVGGVLLALFLLAAGVGNIDFANVVSLLIVLAPSIILHEISHGWMALVFGDRTAKNAGRLTLNPIKHIDPIGTIGLPLALAVAGATPFGYAKPVPVNTVNMSRNQAMLTGLVGPFTNIVLAALALAAASFYRSDMPDWVATYLVNFGRVNVVLAVFNLIPIPPLDGASVIERFMPKRWEPGYYRFRQYSMWILLAIVLLAGSVIQRVIFNPAQNGWFDLLFRFGPDAYYSYFREQILQLRGGV